MAGSRVGPGPATSATGHKLSPLPATPPLGSIQSKRQLATQQARLEEEPAGRGSLGKMGTIKNIFPIFPGEPLQKE